MSKLVSLFAALVLMGAAGITLAQQPAPAASNIKRTPLQKVEIPGTNYEVTAIAEIVPGALAGRHTHPGPETGYVIEGDMVLLVDGQPPKPLKAGESYQIPAGAVHDVKAGDKGMKVMAVYIVEKGKPIASPAP
jgi:quercetin dioxygenase-like cupin family protein